MYHWRRTSSGSGFIHSGYTGSTSTPPRPRQLQIPRGMGVGIQSLQKTIGMWIAKNERYSRSRLRAKIDFGAGASIERPNSDGC